MHFETTCISQGAYDLPEEADACFGEVIFGFEDIEAMRKLPVAPGGFNGLKEYVTIVEATMSSSGPPPPLGTSGV